MVLRGSKYSTKKSRLAALSRYYAPVVPRAPPAPPVRQQRYHWTSIRPVPLRVLLRRGKRQLKPTPLSYRQMSLLKKLLSVYIGSIGASKIARSFGPKGKRK